MNQRKKLKSTEQGKSGTIERSMNVLYNPGILEKLCRLEKSNREACPKPSVQSKSCCGRSAALSFSFLSFLRQCQQSPLWTRRARMGSQIRKLCRGNVASGSACRASLGRLPLRPTKGHLCPRRWSSAASTFVWSLCSSQMACSSPHGSNGRLPRKCHFCKHHWKSPK